MGKVCVFIKAKGLIKYTYFSLYEKTFDDVKLIHSINSYTF